MHISFFDPLPSSRTPYQVTWLDRQTGDRGMTTVYGLDSYESVSIFHRIHDYDGKSVTDVSLDQGQATRDLAMFIALRARQRRPRAALAETQETLARCRIDFEGVRDVVEQVLN